MRCRRRGGRYCRRGYSDAERELQGGGGLAAECETDPGTGEEHAVDAGGSGSGDDRNFLLVQPGHVAEDDGEDGPMDSHCV